MKPRTPGFWLVVATVGLLALLPMQALAGMTPEEVKMYTETKAKAEKGDLEAHFNLAACYARGWGVAQDQAEAVKWIRKAADQGYPMAQFSLGNCYDNGNGVTKNAVEAAKWMRKAADQGFANAQNTLASYYANGKGVAMSQVEAAKWMRKAADQGDALAQYNLGNSYHVGRGVPKDSIEAVKWTRKAAEQDDAPAQYNLGNSYANGEGVAKDTIEAAKWYRKAADQGHAEAAESLDSLNRMTPSKGTPATETTVTTLDGTRVIITKKGNVTNVETVGNLSPNASLTGNTLAEIKPENNPVDLLARAVELFPQNQRAAYQLGLAARLRAQFDQKRVADRTAQQAFSVLTMQPANERVLSWGGGSQTIGAEDHRAVLAWARKSGPPTYHPAWMIQHGMGAFGASSRVGAGLNAGFVAASAWSQVLDDYAKHIDTPSFWVTRHERNNPANFPTLLKGMESRYLSELDAGPTGDVGRQKLRAVVVDFDLKAADPALAFLDARDAMRAIVAAPKSVVPASGEVKAFEHYRAKAEQGQAEAQYYLGMIYRTGSHGVAKDGTVSVIWLTKSAEQGHSRAQYYLGRTYFDFDGNTSGVAKDTPKAVSWWGKAAAQGDADAQEAVGFCYAKGFGGLVKNEIEAYAYQILASRSNASAMAWRGKLEASLSPESLRAGVARSKVLQAAVVVTANSAAPASEVKTPLAEVKSIQDLKAKAVKGDRGAQRDLAMAYGKGEGVAQDYAEAAKWFRKAAEQGDMFSQFATGSNFEHGKGVAKDLAEALRWYRKAADQGYARAQFNVGNSYYHGLGVTRNYAEAIKWYRTCAEEGDVLVAGRALYCLGFCHANGQGVTKNLVEAYAHYDLAGATVADARAGLLDLGSKLTADQLAAAKKRSAALQKELSDKLRSKDKTAKPSQSVTPASAEPAKLPTPQVTKTMAEQRDAYAQYRMGYRYANGDGVEKNPVESLKWYRKAAENGQVEAQYRLGFIYEQGRGVPVDYVESASWWRKAADQGHAGAQFSLGYCYGRGEGVPRNPSEAAKWLHKSADQGNAAAYRFLGNAYDRGEGVRVDKIEAYAYLTIALPGDSYAGGLLDSMTRGMTPSAIQKGKLRAKELQKEIEAKIAAKKARK
jgi:TPR repeat protein